MSMKASVVDLFCGVGGMTHGLLKAGIKVNAGIDSDETCRYAYEYNNGARFIKSDVRQLSGPEVSALYPVGDIKILVGCAPCQPFSTHTQKNDKRNEDERWGLLYAFSSLVKEIKPEVVSMENVPQITRQKVFMDFIKTLQTLRYYVYWDNVKCAAYGVPQTRRRLVLLASKFGQIALIPKTHTKERYRTVREAIGELKAIGDGEPSDGDPLHRSCNLSTINKKRIQQSKPGGTWRDWDEDLRCKCHEESSGQTYVSVYGRMEWDKPSPSLTTQFYNYGTGRFGHPEQERAISLREGALLQTFPRGYRFVAPRQPILFRREGSHIGNAVPVRLGYIIGRSIVEHLNRIEQASN
jgi:DNA (cytosine-5)-methyltransferase 1